MMAAMEIGSVVLKAKSISGISAAFAASTTSPDVGERIIAAGEAECFHFNRDRNYIRQSAVMRGLDLLRHRIINKK